MHHWRIAYGSAKEVDTHLRLLVGAGAINASIADSAIRLFDDVRALDVAPPPSLGRLIASGSPARCSADFRVGVMAPLNGTDAHLEVGATRGAPFAALGPRERGLPLGCRVRHCAGSTFRRAAHPAQWRYRDPPGRATKAPLPAQKEAAGVPSAWSQTLESTTRATTPMGRRWAAEGGPEGRGCGIQARDRFATGSPSQPRRCRSFSRITSRRSRLASGHCSEVL